MKTHSPTDHLNTTNPSSAKLRTENPEHLTYTHPPMDIAVLGGIKLEGLDRMRVTLKITIEEQSVRHNLDLYNTLQTDKLCRLVAERLEIGTSVVHEALMALTDHLEAHRLEQKEQELAGQQKEKKFLTPERIKECKKELKSVNLMERTAQYLRQSGIVGEDINALVLWVVMTSRKCPDPLSAISLAKSGMGKSYLQERVAACIPEEDIIESTMITESSFYRFGRDELRGKVFLIEDLDGAENVLYPIREMQSKKRISKTITTKDSQGRMKTVTLTVEGPVSVCGCTTREHIYEDNANRSLLLYLDNTREQDHKIMYYQKQVKAGEIDTVEEEKIQEKLQDMQRVLLPVRVINPYALQINLPEEVFKPRRTMALLLSFIEAVTWYHQYQREIITDAQTNEPVTPKGGRYIRTTIEDIEWSFKLLRDVLFRKSDELSGACREFCEWLKKWAAKLETEGHQFYASQIRKSRRIHPRTLNRYLQELTLHGYLQITGGNKHKTGYRYQLATEQENLQDRIDEQLNKVLTQVKAASEQTTQRRKSA